MRCFALIAALCIVGCDGQRKAEAAQLTDAIARLRDAPRGAREPRITELERLPCTGDDACSARDTCVRGYRRAAQGESRLRAVKHDVTADAGPAGASPDTALLLLAAERDLDAARPDLERCTVLESDLRARYRLTLTAR